LRRCPRSPCRHSSFPAFLCLVRIGLRRFPPSVTAVRVGPAFLPLARSPRVFPCAGIHAGFLSSGGAAVISCLLGPVGFQQSRLPRVCCGSAGSEVTPGLNALFRLLHTLVPLPSAPRCSCCSRLCAPTLVRASPPTVGPPLAGPTDCRLCVLPAPCCCALALLHFLLVELARTLPRGISGCPLAAVLPAEPLVLSSVVAGRESWCYPVLCTLLLLDAVSTRRSSRVQSRFRISSHTHSLSTHPARPGCVAANCRRRRALA